jgi:hypothetical protein
MARRDGSIGRSVHDALVVLVPAAGLDRRSDRNHTHRVVRTDQNGSFDLRGFVPGDYNVYAFSPKEIERAAQSILDPVGEAFYSRSLIEDGAYMNAEFMDRYENRRRALSLSKNGERTITLSLPAN